MLADNWMKLINDVYAMEPKLKDNQRLSRAIDNGCYAVVCEELRTAA